MQLPLKNIPDRSYLYTSKEIKMKALIQRVSRGSVTVDGEKTGEIGPGFAILIGVRNSDTGDDARHLAEKTANLRIFPDDNDKMNRSLLDTGRQALVISQFTLYADIRKGNRPSFTNAAPPELAERLYDLYTDHLRKILGSDRVATGVFRATMTVEIVNEGPVTIELCTDREPDQ